MTAPVSLGWPQTACFQPAGLADVLSSPSPVLYLSGSPGLEPASLRGAQRQTACGALRRRAAQRKFPAVLCTVVWCDPSLISCCAACRFSERTACVLEWAMEVCFLCLLVCLEPRRYFALIAWTHTAASPADSHFSPCGLSSGLRFGKLQNVEAGYWTGKQLLSKVLPWFWKRREAPWYFLNKLWYYIIFLQVLEANSMTRGVELLEIRPDQLSSNDLGGEQVAVERYVSVMCSHDLRQLSVYI